MKHTRFLGAFMAIALLFSNFAKADEGMWLPLLLKRLNEADMKKKGCKLTADEIYNINKGSLKDAIVMLSGGSCTAEVISADGLLLTNHHCGYDAVQENSSVENDYLANGFWAKNKSEELKADGLTASFLIRIEDVTQRVLSQLNNDMTEAQRSMAVRMVSSQIEKEAVGETHYNASVKSFFNGNEYYLFVYETFTDVRIVGVPPESIGKFGGDTDNWMWPRHTGDFTLLRVYTGPDGKPATYNTANIPLKAKYHLPISLDGVKEGDFTMVMGYPGTTDRYLTSFGVEQALNITNQEIVKIRDKKLKIMKEDMDASNEIRIKYASKYAQTANYWKYFIGQTAQLKNNNVVSKKKDLENRFIQWVGNDQQRLAKYGNALRDIEAGYKDLGKVVLNRTYLSEAILQGPAILMFSYQMDALKPALGAEADEAEKKEIIESLKDNAKNHFRDFNLSTDKKLMEAMLKMYAESIPKEQLPPLIDSLKYKTNGDYATFVNDLYNRSAFATSDRFNALMANPTLAAIESDPAYKTVSGILKFYTEKFRPQISEIQSRIEKGNRAFVAGLREMMPEKKFYPNANSTMRLTYGSIEDYKPRDAVEYEEVTTLKGVMEKEDPSNPEFVVPAKLKELYNKKDYGIYGANGELITCFISTNDITGGNSGSPVINAKGELIGCAFDGNWEAMSGDIFFEPNVQRTISVDIRYVLFVIDKFADAGHIVDEMTLKQKGKIVKRM
jgi:hypothetical protein